MMRADAASSAGRISTTLAFSSSGVRPWNGWPGSRSAGFCRSPSSPPVQQTSTVCTPSAWYRATVGAPLDASSSGWAWTVSSVSRPSSLGSSHPHDDIRAVSPPPGSPTLPACPPPGRPCRVVACPSRRRAARRVRHRRRPGAAAADERAAGGDDRRPRRPRRPWPASRRRAAGASPLPTTGADGLGRPGAPFTLQLPWAPGGADRRPLHLRRRGPLAAADLERTAGRHRRDGPARDRRRRRRVRPLGRRRRSRRRPARSARAARSPARSQGRNDFGEPGWGGPCPPPARRTPTASRCTRSASRPSCPTTSPAPTCWPSPARRARPWPSPPAPTPAPAGRADPACATGSGAGARSARRRGRQSTSVTPSR